MEAVTLIIAVAALVISVVALVRIQDIQRQLELILSRTADALDRLTRGKGTPPPGAQSGSGPST